jgi:hypothetical protein
MERIATDSRFIFMGPVILGTVFRYECYDGPIGVKYTYAKGCRQTANTRIFELRLAPKLSARAA